MADPVNRQPQRQQPAPQESGAGIGGMGGIFGFLKQLFGGLFDMDGNGGGLFGSLFGGLFGKPTPQEDAANVRKTIINQQQADLAAKGLYPSTGKFAQDGNDGSVMQHAQRLQDDPNYARQYMKQALRDPNMDAIDIMKLQGAMNKLGYNSGDVDGRMDNQARAALGKYLKDHPEDKRTASADVLNDSKPRTGVFGWFAQVKDTVMSAKDNVFAPSTTPGSSKGLLDIIGKHESNGNYNAYYKHADNNSVRFTDMTVNEVLAWQRKYVNDGSASSAVGKYQIIQKTMRGLKEDMNLTGNEKFTPELQDRMAMRLLEQRGLNRFKNGGLTADQFMNNVAHEWASMPKDRSGRGAYDGDGLNKSLTGAAPVLAAIEDIKRAPVVAPAVALAARSNDIDFGRPAKQTGESMEQAGKRLAVNNSFSVSSLAEGASRLWDKASDYLFGKDEPATRVASASRSWFSPG